MIADDKYLEEWDHHEGVFWEYKIVRTKDTIKVLCKYITFVHEVSSENSLILYD